MAGWYPNEFVDELREKADIVAIISRHVQLTPRGGRYWGLCPFHGEKTPSFSVTPEKQMYYCFGCHAGGTVLNFLMQYEHLEFPEAVERLAEETHTELPRRREGREDLPRGVRERLYEANTAAARFYHQQLWRPENAPILNYLHGRGLDDRIIRVFGLGATPAASDGATQSLFASGFTEDELVAAGISLRREGRAFDVFRSRAIFPIIDARGRVLGFGGRALGDAKPKYLNTGDTPIFNKRRGVYAENLLAKQRNLSRVILTEGYMDVIALVQAGIPGVCATLGTALTPEQARLIRRYAKEVWVSYDGDSAGQHAILRALDIFEALEVRARVLDFPAGMDPDEFVRQNGPAAMESLSPMDAVSYRMLREAERHEMNTQEGRTEYAKACAVWLARVREPVELENYVQRLMIETGFSREVLMAQIGRSAAPGNERQPRPIRDRKAAPSQRENAGAEAPEEMLLRLIADGGVAEGELTPEDFITEKNRAVVRELLSGKTPAALLEETEDEAERSRLAAVFSRDEPIEGEDRLRAIRDCLSLLHRQRIDGEIESLRAALETQTGEARQKTLSRILELTGSRRALEIQP